MGLGSARVVSLAEARAKANELSRYEVLGAGIVSRVVRDLQREHMTRPRYRTGVTKWS